MEKEVTQLTAINKLEAIGLICLNLSFMDDLNMDSSILYFLGCTFLDICHDELS